MQPVYEYCAYLKQTEEIFFFKQRLDFNSKFCVNYSKAKQFQWRNVKRACNNFQTTTAVNQLISLVE